MKPKDLVIPFDWENRKPIILQNLLYVPKYYNKHHEFQEEIKFETNGNINIEFCSGNGQWIIQKTKENPHNNYLAVEMKFDRARKIWAKLHNENLKNLFVVLADARTFVKYYLKKETISDVFINFPDPWPKKKHAKHRLIQDEFISDVAKVMKNNRTITLVTDHIDYLEQIIEVLLKNTSFKSTYKKPYYVKELRNFGTSFFDALFRRKSKDIHYVKFKRN